MNQDSVLQSAGNVTAVAQNNQTTSLCVRVVCACLCVFVYSLIGLGSHKALGQVGLTLAQILKFDL